MRFVESYLENSTAFAWPISLKAAGKRVNSSLDRLWKERLKFRFKRMGMYSAGGLRREENPISIVFRTPYVLQSIDFINPFANHL